MEKLLAYGLKVSFCPLHEQTPDGALSVQQMVRGYA